MKRLSMLFISVAFVSLLAPCAEAQFTVTTLLTMTGDSSTGGSPESSLIFDSAGNLYGTTSGPAEVFQLSPNSDGTWTENILWKSLSASDPSDIRPGVVFDAAGNLFATSVSGGQNGCGTVFKLSHNSDGTWSEKNLVDFDCGSGGSFPVGGVTLDIAGNVFGGTTQGGNFGNGVIFELTPDSDGSYTEKVIHHFTGGNDGRSPDHPFLVFDSSGNLYGSAAQGGQHNCPDFSADAGCGTIFKLTPRAGGTWALAVLHTFTGGADGGNPQATLLFDKAGNLYGTTWEGGQYGQGVAFELIPHANGKWGEKVLHAFKSGGDGANPFGGLISDAAGNLYGTTSVGGNNQCGNSSLPVGCGVVYELTPNSKGTMTETILIRFHGTPNATPYNDLLMDSTGNLYGTAAGYGAANAGAVYEVVRSASEVD
jgi:hypothetical protein